jgi:Sec-independent protein translocase protein TatA
MLVLMTLRAFMRKLWAFIRSNVWIACLVVALIVVVVLGFASRRGHELIGTMWNMIRRERQQHVERVAEIDRINADEKEARARAARRALDAVKQAERQYAERNERLDGEKKAEIKRIVMSADDPTEIARRLASAYGFTYIESEGAR